MTSSRFHVELRSAEITAHGTLYGHAAVFGQHAQIRGGYEALAPGAFDEALKRDNVRALINHDPSKLLGSSAAGTLKLDTDDIGLRFEVQLPDTSYARDLRVLVERGDLAGASFGFIPGTDERGVAPDGRQIRMHTGVRKILDVSAVTYPAYDATDVCLRSLTFGPPAIDRRTQIILARHRALTRRYPT